MMFFSATLCSPASIRHTKLTRSMQRLQSKRRDTPDPLSSIDKGRTMDTANVRWPRSLWVAVTPPGPDLPRLIGTAEADVVVIAGGFTGLSTALHLREAGVDVAIVEAMEPGWGASGRNNGQVIPTLSRHDPMATQPLSDTARETIIPGRQAMSGTHGELYFARYDARNPVVTGGARC